MRTVGTGRDAERTTITAHGLWKIGSAGVTPVDRAWSGPLTVLVPAEQVLVAVVDLPFASRRQRRDAAPFALEGLIAEPLDQVHIALGAEVAPRRHLCAIVRHSLMRRWVADLETTGLAGCVMVPDALMLPVPPAGVWSVVVEGPRALVRTDDGAGFALDLAALPAAWAASGKPGLAHDGKGLPEVMRAGLDALALETVGSASPALFAPPIDLRQSPYAARRDQTASPWRWAAWAAAAGVVGHIALTGLDAVALDTLADRREAETRRMVAQARPDLQTASDLTSAVDQIAPRRVWRDGPFIRRWGQVARALSGQPFGYRALTYSADQSMTLSVVARDADALDAAVKMLAASAVPATSALAPVESGTILPEGLNALITLPSTGSTR